MDGHRGVGFDKRKRQKWRCSEKENDGLPIVLPARFISFEKDGGILASESETVADGLGNGLFSWLIGNIVQVAAFCRMIEVDRRVDLFPFKHQRRCNGFYSP